MNHKIKTTLAILSAAAFVTLGFSSCKGKKGEEPEIEVASGYTVRYDLPTDGSLPTDHTGVENIGYLAEKLLSAPAYTVDMHSTVDALGGLYSQAVESYKDYSNGVMVTTDIARSSLVNSAWQTCFFGSTVLMRDPASSKAKDWKERETAWSTATPQKFSLGGYTAVYGLSSMEFSAYVLNEDTIVSASEVTLNEDGTYSQTFSFDTVESAPFYRVRMQKIGGLASLPDFNSITATFTFTEDWTLLSTRYVENYAIQKGILSLTCVADTLSEYAYDGADISAYETFFSAYADAEETDPADKQTERGVGDYLSDAFAPVLVEETAFYLTLACGDSTLEAYLLLNLEDGIGVKASIGECNIAFIDDKLHIVSPDLNGFISLDSLMEKLSTEEEGDGSSLDTDALLEQLGDGELIKGENGSVTLTSSLTLGSLSLPVTFAFYETEDSVSLSYLETSLLLDGTPVSVHLLPAVKGRSVEVYEADRDLSGYVDYLVDYILDRDLSIDLSYRGGDISLNGTLVLSGDTLGVELKGDLLGCDVSLTAYFEGETVYLSVDRLAGETQNLKYRVDTQKVGDLISALASTDSEEGAGILGKALEALLAFRYNDDFKVYQDDFGVSVNLWAKNLLNALGVDLPLGTLSLRVGDSYLHGEADEFAFTVKQGKDLAALEKEDYLSLDRIVENVGVLSSLLNGDKKIVVNGYLNNRYVQADVRLGEAVTGKILLDNDEIYLVYKAGGLSLILPGASSSLYIPFSALDTGDTALLDIDTLTLVTLIRNVVDSLSVVTDEGSLLRATVDLNGSLGFYKVEATVREESVKITIPEAFILGLRLHSASVSLLSSDGEDILLPSVSDSFTLSSRLGLCLQTDVDGVGVRAHVRLSLSPLTVVAEVTARTDGEEKTVFASFGGDKLDLVLPDLNVRLNASLTELEGLLSGADLGGSSLDVATLVAGLVSSVRVNNGYLNFELFGVNLKVRAEDGALVALASQLDLGDIALRGTSVRVGDYYSVPVFYPTENQLESYTAMTSEDILSLVDLFTGEEGLDIGFSYANLDLVLRMHEGDIYGAVNLKNDSGEVESSILLQYDGEKVYLVINGESYLSATLDELLSLFTDLTSPAAAQPTAFKLVDTASEQTPSFLGGLLKNLLSEDLSALLAFERGEDSALNVSLNASKLLSVFLGDGIEILPEGTSLSLSLTSDGVQAKIYEQTVEGIKQVGSLALLPTGADQERGEKLNEVTSLLNSALADKQFTSLDTFVESGLNKTLSLLLSQNYAVELLAEIDSVPVQISAVANLNDKALFTASLALGKDSAGEPYQTAYISLTENAIAILLPDLNLALEGDREKVEELLSLIPSENIPSDNGGLDISSILSTVLPILQNLTVEDNASLTLDLNDVFAGLKINAALKKEDGSLTLSLGENFAPAGIPVFARLSLSSGEGKSVPLPCTDGFVCYTTSDAESFARFVGTLVKEGATFSLTYEDMALSALVDKNGELCLTIVVGGKDIFVLTRTVEKKGEEMKQLLLVVDEVKVALDVDDIVSAISALLSDDVAVTETSPDSRAIAVGEILNKLLAVDYSEYITFLSEEDKLAMAVDIDDLLSAFDVNFEKDCSLSVTFNKENGEKSADLTVRLTLDGLEKPVLLTLLSAKGETVPVITGEVLDVREENNSFTVDFDTFLNGDEPRFHVNVALQVKDGNVKDGEWAFEDENGVRPPVKDQLAKLYIYAEIALKTGSGAEEGDEDLYLTAMLKENKMYISASRYDKANASDRASYSPLLLSFGLDEMGELLGAAVKLVGFDTDIFDSFFDESGDFMNQLTALSNKIDIGGLLGDLLASDGSSSDPEEADVVSVGTLKVKNINHNPITEKTPANGKYIDASDAMDLIEMLVNTAVLKDGEDYLVKNSFRVSGEVHASVLGIYNVDVPTQIGLEIVDGASAPQAIDVNVKLLVPFALGVTNAKTTTILTIHLPLDGGAAMIKATRTASSTTLVREMTADYFLSHIKDQIKFILNTSSIVNLAIGNDGEEEEKEPSTLDYGKYLEEFTKTDTNGSGNYFVKLDGANLTDGLLGSLKLTVNYLNNVLSSLVVDTNLSVLTLSATLNYPDTSADFVTTIDNTALFNEKVSSLIGPIASGKTLDYWEYNLTRGTLNNKHFAVEQYPVLFNAGEYAVSGYKKQGGSFVKEVKKDFESEYLLPAIEEDILTPSGKKYFVGWAKTPNGEIISSLTIPDSATTLYAVWGDIYATTLVYGEGLEEETLEVRDSLAATSPVQLPSEKISSDKEKYLSGWLVNGEEKPVGYSFTASENSSVTAIWSPVTVTLESEYALNEAGDKQIVLQQKYQESYRTEYIGLFNEDESYVLVYWTSPAGERVESVLPVAGNITLTAVWKDATTRYTVTLDLLDRQIALEEGVLTEQTTYSDLFGYQIVLPAAGTYSTDGKSYLYGFTDGENTVSGGMVAPSDGTVTYRAIWKGVYDVNIVNEYGENDSFTKIQTVDDQLTLLPVGTLTPDGKHILKAWNANTSTSYDASNAITVIEDVTFTAEWVNYYKFTLLDSMDSLYEEEYTSSTAGSYTLPAGKADPDEAAANEKYAFAGWWKKVDGEWILATNDNLEAGETTLTAMWAKLTVTETKGTNTRSGFALYSYKHTLTIKVALEVSSEIADRSATVSFGLAWTAKPSSGSAVTGAVNGTYNKDTASYEASGSQGVHGNVSWTYSASVSALTYQLN